MPISQFADGLQRAISFLPGTYGTSLVRNHAMNGVFKEMAVQGFPDEVIEAIKDSVDCNLYFFESKVEIPQMYAILGTACVALIAAYIIMNTVKIIKAKQNG